jgi:hypothetical protein
MENLSKEYIQEELKKVEKQKSLLIEQIHMIEGIRQYLLELQKKFEGEPT